MGKIVWSAVSYSCVNAVVLCESVIVLSSHICEDKCIYKHQTTTVTIVSVSLSTKSYNGDRNTNI